jgi:hypothetical protein
LYFMTIPSSTILFSLATCMDFRPRSNKQLAIFRSSDIRTRWAGGNVNCQKVERDELPIGSCAKFHNELGSLRHYQSLRSKPHGCWPGTAQVRWPYWSLGRSTRSFTRKRFVVLAGPALRTAVLHICREARCWPAHWNSWDCRKFRLDAQTNSLCALCLNSCRACGRAAFR